MTITINEARAIPLYVLVQALGGKYSHSDRNQQHWYFSPFRPTEKTASFKINEPRNKWFDFGHVGGHAGSGSSGAGGDILDLWSDYHGKERRSSIKDALAALQAYAGSNSKQLDRSITKRPKERIVGDASDKPGSRYRILNLHQRIRHAGLLDELNRRRINVKTASRFLQQAVIIDRAHSNSKYTGFALRNDKGGHELSIPNPGRGSCFKTSVTAKAPTTYRALISNKVMVFEGMWDFLAWQEMQDAETPEHHSIILNSLSFCSEIAQKIKAAKDEIDVVCLFLDNDDAGKKAAHFMACELEQDFTLRSMDSLYQHHKDLSDYWAKDPGAKRISEQHSAAKRYTGDAAATVLAPRHAGQQYRPR